jgi:hypothetical protein
VQENLESPSNEARRAERAAAIGQFGERFLESSNRDLLEEMLLTICRLARDPIGRGDVKLLHKALAELRYAYKVFAPYRHVRKISVFGSSRTPEHHADYHSAAEFSRRMAEAGWMVVTGAGDGIMKAGHHGAGRERSFGVAIRLPFEQKTNTVIANDPKLVNFRYFFTRKLMFVRQASAVALFPGGFGTMDEGFEALTLVQTGKAPIVPIVMIERPGGTYWQRWDEYVRRELLAPGLIGPEDLRLYRITDDVSAAVAEVVGFYRVFHSMRFVHDDLILRLERRLSDTLIERLNDEFGSMVTSGRIEQCGPLPQERDELPDKPRLRMQFDRKSFGLLRRCIDTINRDGGMN